MLVVSDQNDVHGTNAQESSTWPSVLIVPVSTNPSYKTKFDVKIDKGEGNLPREGWARVPGLQMIDKDLVGDMTGQVRKETLAAVTSQILNYLGILDVEPEADEELGF